MDVAKDEPIDAERLLRVLSERSGTPDLAYAEAPTELGRGGEAIVDAFRLAGEDAEWSEPLVVRRVMSVKDGAQLEHEAAVHRALEELGFPAPRLLLTEPSDAILGSPFLVTTRLEGKPLLEEIKRPAELLKKPTRLPRLFADAVLRIPRLLAKTQALLHELDPRVMRRQLRERNLSEDSLDFDPRLDRLSERVGASELSGLEPVVAWLRAHRPEGGRDVICHGDLVFTNLCCKEDA